MDAVAKSKVGATYIKEKTCDLNLFSVSAKTGLYCIVAFRNHKVLDGYRRKVVRITAAKLDGTAVYMDFILPVLNNDIILFSVQKERNHQSHYKAEAKGGRGGSRK
jgi:hypothetical protein